MTADIEKLALNFCTAFDHTNSHIEFYNKDKHKILLFSFSPDQLQAFAEAVAKEVKAENEALKEKLQRIEDDVQDNLD